MNIKINEELATVLLNKTLDTIQFGNPDGEDTDLLHIISPNYQMDNTILDNNHTLFYKNVGSNTDHLFVTPKGYMQGMITGGSTLFIELVMEGKTRGTCLDFLHENLPDVYYDNYKVLKAFIGCAKRDWKQANNHKDAKKKLHWANMYNDLVRSCINLPTVLNPITLGEIEETRAVLNRAYQVEGTIPYSIDRRLYSELQRELNLMKTVDIPELNELSLYYFDVWSED